MRGEKRGGDYQTSDFFLLLHVGNRPVGWERKRIERQGKREEEGGGRQRGRSVRDRERVERTRKEKGG